MMHSSYFGSIRSLSKLGYRRLGAWVLQDGVSLSDADYS